MISDNGTKSCGDKGITVEKVPSNTSQGEEIWKLLEERQNK